ncbi:hypothetical protein [Chitinimonas sp. BJYL2]|uniref:hypothetical protein n=1 Tax=Chitinimonas sp. BJYL2 TaxID=2976696 RepID=UPI0022B4015D|nr:hypothetical protein [Chitinimonas sp. BJYL2]
MKHRASSVAVIVIFNVLLIALSAWSLRAFIIVKYTDIPGLGDCQLVEGILKVVKTNSAHGHGRRYFILSKDSTREINFEVSGLTEYFNVVDVEATGSQARVWVHSYWGVTQYKIGPFKGGSGEDISLNSNYANHFTRMSKMQAEGPPSRMPWRGKILLMTILITVSGVISAYRIKKILSKN